MRTKRQTEGTKDSGREELGIKLELLEEAWIRANKALQLRLESREAERGEFSVEAMNTPMD